MMTYQVIATAMRRSYISGQRRRGRDGMSMSESRERVVGVSARTPETER